MTLNESTRVIPDPDAGRERCALAVAHPGHELWVHGWLEPEQTILARPNRRHHRREATARGFFKRGRAASATGANALTKIRLSVSPGPAAVLV